MDVTPPSTLRRLGIALAGLAVAALTGAACVLSFDDLRSLAVRGEARPDLAYLYPAAFDALLAVALISVLLVRSARTLVRAQAALVLVLLIVAAAAVNVLAALRYEFPISPTAVGVAVAPWAMLAVALWLWLLLIKHVQARRPAPTGDDGTDPHDIVPFDGGVRTEAAPRPGGHHETPPPLVTPSDAVPPPRRPVTTPLEATPVVGPTAAPETPPISEQVTRWHATPEPARDPDLDPTEGSGAARGHERDDTPQPASKPDAQHVPQPEPEPRFDPAPQPEPEPQPQREPEPTPAGREPAEHERRGLEGWEHEDHRPDGREREGHGPEDREREGHEPEEREERELTGREPESEVDVTPDSGAAVDAERQPGLRRPVRWGDRVKPTDVLVHPRQSRAAEKDVDTQPVAVITDTPSSRADAPTTPEGSAASQEGRAPDPHHGAEAADDHERRVTDSPRAGGAAELRDESMEDTAPHPVLPDSGPARAAQDAPSGRLRSTPLPPEEPEAP
ncbi:DUF2637 domain-containing protein [Nonomuraea sp. NPDC049714]|uniref:DUF2637 domain-containing protein n=1 Tax=Nonomuraea sp. NPDC049714 TaxID=3364357 RepID=UPI0037A2242A